jgi:general secretion pathway protein D
MMRYGETIASGLAPPRPALRPSQYALWLCGAAALLSLAGCGNLLADDCSVAKQVAAPGGGASCASAKAERTVLFSGDDYPRLWTGAAPRTAPNVDASALDRPPQPNAGGNVAPAGYFGTVRANYSQDAPTLATDIAEIRDSGATNFDPEENISINFDHASLNFVLKQLLGGALGVNYIAPDNLGGSVTFHSENPLPKSQVLSVIRDILGRNGLAMIYLNGVYEIGSSDDLKQIQAADQDGADKVSRVVRVRKGSAADVVSLAQQLVPTDVSMTATNTDDAILVRASGANIDNAADLVSSLVDDGAGEDKMAIIRVHQAPADVIANQIQAFYQGRLGKSEDLTIVPLVAQQALLVGSHDSRLLDGLRVLVEQLDRITKPEASLRIIQLTYLSASDIVPQLTAIFGGKDIEPAAAAAKSSSAGTNASSSPSPFGAVPSFNSNSAGTLSGDVGTNSQNLSNPNVSPPPGGSSGSASDGAGAGPHDRGPASTPAPEDGGGDVKFVADTRDNAVMIYSSYEFYQRVKDVLKTIDVPQAQVVIEATIADVTLNDQLQYGVQWFLNSQGLTVRSSQTTSTADPGTAGGFASIGASLGGISANVLLNALQSITTVKVISSPYLTVVDGKEARLVIGDEIPYTTTTQNSSSNGTSTITNAITTMDTGVILDVTPKILSNDSVDLNIDQEVTQPVDGTTNANNDPTIDTRSVKSDVMAESGHTIVLGGMIQETVDRTENGTPVAQSLPVIGNLFKTKSDTGSRTELLVMITPRVVRQSAQLENVTRLLRDQLHIN